MTDTLTDTDELRRMGRYGIDSDGIFRWKRPLPDILIAAADELDALRSRANDADELWRHCEMLRRALKAACDDGWTDGEGAFDRYVRDAFVDVAEPVQLYRRQVRP